MEVVVMSMADIFSSISDIFLKLQLWSGLSPPAFLLLFWSTYKSFCGASEESDNVMVILGKVGMSLLFWWLVGFLIVNPLWSMLLANL